MKINWKNIHYFVIIIIIFNFLLLYYLKNSNLKENEIISNENEKISTEKISNETIFLLKKKNFPETKINPNDSVSQVAESIGAQGKVPQTTYLIENNIKNEENNLIHIFLSLFSIILTIFIINFLVELGEKQKKTFSTKNNNNSNENSVTNYILMDEDI
jgi:predicted permease